MRLPAVATSYKSWRRRTAPFGASLRVCVSSPFRRGPRRYCAVLEFSGVSEHINQAVALWGMTPYAPDVELTLEDFLHRPEWHQQALCRGEAVAMFVRAPKADYGRLRAVCGDCPVRTECLEFALADDSLIGLWGGTTDAERRELRRSRVA
jgi:WhiB family transcriptional regulator, redox-sensing transcriptional regulator